MNLRQIAHALGGEVSGGRVLAPGPGHSCNDRSLAVSLSRQSDDGLVVHSFSGDDWRECKEHVRAQLGITRERRRITPSVKRKIPEAPSKDNSRRARDLFYESRDPRGTLAEQYLAKERGLHGVIDDTLALTIRFHPACHFGREKAPALICALRDPYRAMKICSHLDDMGALEQCFLQAPHNVLAVQRIRLTADGKKVERKTLGPMANSVVLVSSIWESFYSATATIAEGVETALAMRKLGFHGCAALAGAGRFRTFEPPFHWGQITISGENDAGASQSAWRDAGPRWAAAGHDVDVWAPLPGLKDANDVVLARAREGRAA